MKKARMMLLGGCVRAVGTMAPAAHAAAFPAQLAYWPDFITTSYSASPGERNAATASFDDPGTHAIVPAPASASDNTLTWCRFELRRVTCDNVLGGVETGYGAASADVIIGGPANETFYGSGGDDRLAGGPGEDWLEGDHGNDRLELDDGEPDRHGCYDGTDEVLADPSDVFAWGFPDDCETVTVEG